MNNIPILMPSPKILQNFETLVGKLAVLRDTLLPKLMSGEIDVSTIQL